MHISDQSGYGVQGGQEKVYPATNLNLTAVSVLSFLNSIQDHEIVAA